MLRAVSGRADLEVVGNSASGFAYKTLEKIKETPGSIGCSRGQPICGFILGGKRAKARILCIDPRVDQDVRDYKIIEGKGLEGTGEVLIDSSFARSMNIRTGDTIKILAKGSLGKGGMPESKVVGIVEPAVALGLPLGHRFLRCYLMPIASFAVVATSIRYKSFLDNPDDVEQIQSALMQVLPPDARVQPPATRSQMAEETLFATENGLHMAIAFTLLIALFIIYNTFQMSVGERRKQFGILRALGTTRGQIRWMILREALMMSLVACAVGCLLGINGATYLSRTTSKC